MVFQSRNPTSVTYGTETVSYMAPKKWTLKNFDSLKSFKKKEKKKKKWKPEPRCRLCQAYLQHLGFV